MAESIDVAERDLVTVTLRKLVRQHDGAQLAAALRDFGFADVLAAQQRAAVSALFDALGRGGATSTAMHDVLALPLAGLLPDSACGHSVVMPPIGEPLAGSATTTTVTLRGLAIAHRVGAAVVAPVGMNGHIAWVHVTDPAGLSTRAVGGLDPTLGLTELSTLRAPSTLLVAGPRAKSLWNTVATAGRRALAYQITGAVSRMIELAVTHACDRTQFGRPIGAFQAVRTRLADAYVAHAGAVGALEAAWAADDEYLAGMLAKSLAGRAARIAGTHCQQVLAGIGFTAEHPFHRFLTRALVLDSLLGSAGELPRVIGTYLAAGDTVPRLVDL